MSRREERLSREIESHLRMAIQDRIERGESPVEAEANARREFGNKGLIAEVTRDMWAWNWVEQSWRDVRYALRALQRNPAFTIASLTALTLGIGAITAVFSVVNSVLLRPLPYAEPERLVWIHDGMTAHDPQGWSACVADFLLWRDRAHSFSSLAAFGTNGFILTGVGEAELLRGAAVTAAFFEALGVRPIIGRTFAADEDRPGREPTALISENLWRRRFGSDPAVVGKKVALNGRQTTIIGVLPASFHFRLREADIWGIFTLDPPTRRGPFTLRMRLAIRTVPQSRIPRTGT